MLELVLVLLLMLGSWEVGVAWNTNNRNWNRK